MYVGGAVIPYDTASTTKRYFDYKVGTNILFNSHLLHGTKSLDVTSEFPPDELEKFRVSLSSVWLHKENLNFKVLTMPETDYHHLYLSRHAPEFWPELRKNFGQSNYSQHFSMRHIIRLVCVGLDEIVNR